MTELDYVIQQINECKDKNMMLKLADKLEQELNIMFYETGAYKDTEMDVFVDALTANINNDLYGEVL